MLVSSISYMNTNQANAVPVTNKKHQNNNQFGHVQNKTNVQNSSKNIIKKLIETITSALSKKTKDSRFSTIA